MSTITAFNKELLHTVFNKVESIAQLAQCRLVCKAWKDPAAKAMFSKRIIISSETRAIKLYRHLFIDPGKANSISHLHFNITSTLLPAIIKELLGIAITSSIKHITGTVEAEDFFLALFSLMDDPTLRLNKLITLPEYTGQDANVKLERFTRMKKTLTRMTLTLGCEDDEIEKRYIDQLVDCKKLTTLTLKGRIVDAQHLEIILRGCPRLTDLKFVDVEFDGNRASQAKSSESQKKEVFAWNERYTEQEDYYMENIEIRSLCRPDLFEYLYYKYPYTMSIKVKGKLYLGRHNASLAGGSLDRILDAIKDVPYKQMTLILPPSTKAKDLFLFMRNRGLGYSLDVEQVDGKEELLLEIHWTHKDEETSSQEC